MAPRLILPVLLLLLAGCGGTQTPPEIQWQAFNGARALAHVEKLVSFGPRPSGSDALNRSATYLTTQLREYGLTAEEQVFNAGTPNGPVMFRNIVAKTQAGRGGAGRVIILASHYDTKLLPGMRFVGANDAGSSTGVLLELARVLANQPDVWFVFFDGEEAVKEYGPGDGLWGSKFFVEDLKGNQQTGWIKAMILLDMVGDANLNIQLPANGAGWLMQLVFDAARETGHRDYFGYRGAEVLDDHVPFLNAGIPAVDLIDFDYGSASGQNDYWHTDKDTLDKLSPRSMEIVGQTTLRLVSLLRNPAATD